jgi:hypothetical protein
LEGQNDEPHDGIAQEPIVRPFRRSGSDGNAGLAATDPAAG